MIFVMASNEPTLFLMLAEGDVKSMRLGHTKFVDKRMLNKYTFNKVIVSLHKTDEDALECIRQAGHRVPELPNPEPIANETRCLGCSGLILTASMFEGRCIVCWANMAKKLITDNN